MVDVTRTKSFTLSAAASPFATKAVVNGLKVKDVPGVICSRTLETLLTNLDVVVESFVKSILASSVLAEASINAEDLPTVCVRMASVNGVTLAVLSELF
jgi:hypothetical protein